MTFEELHEILDNPDVKLNPAQFKEILYKLRLDAHNELYKLEPTNHNYQFYSGEANAFMIALDLAEHLIDG